MTSKQINWNDLKFKIKKRHLVVSLIYENLINLVSFKSSYEFQNVLACDGRAVCGKQS